MYHEVTTGDRVRRLLRQIAAIIVLAALVWAVAYFYGPIRSTMQDQAAASIRSSVLKAAMQCCAVEGSYPLTLGYLQDNYGLHVNETDYVINYEAFASNVLPSVTVVPKHA